MQWSSEASFEYREFGCKVYKTFAGEANFYDSNKLRYSVPRAPLYTTHFAGIKPISRAAVCSDH